MTRCLVPAHAQPPDFAKSADWQQLIGCPLCGSESLRTVKLAYDPHYGNQGQFPVDECVGCGLNFMNPMPTAEYLSKAYPSEYYSYHYQSPRTLKQRVVKKLKRLARALIYYHSSKTMDPKFRTPGTMLDIGCGAGSFLAEMRDKGWKVYGAELSPDAAERGRIQSGLEIFGGTVHDAKFPSKFFDYVRTNHSFEHVHNPREVIREIRRILKPNGKLFIGVPNVTGLAARKWGIYWWYLGAPVHTFGYSANTLSRLLNDEGFVVERVNYNSTYAGIFGSLQIYLNRNSDNLSEEGHVFKNPVLMLTGHWLARLTDLLQMGDCIEVIARPR